MFLRPFRRTKDGKTHTYFALVESVRTPGGPRQRIVAQLGELSADDQRRWERTALFHTRHSWGRELPRAVVTPEGRLFPEDVPPVSAGQVSPVPAPDDPDVVRIRLDRVRWSNPRSFGDVWLGLHLWRLLGLDEIVARHVPPGDEDVPPATVVAIEVIARLCIGQGGPTSEFGLAEHGYARTALEDLLGVPDAQITKDRLYRTLDQLLAGKDGIELDLKERLGVLFGLSFDLLLCDLSSSFFEGLCEESELTARGYSRDHRSDCKQVILAMVVTPDGFPLYHEVFKGNTNDATSLPTILAVIERQFGQARRVWVLDRGLATKKNIDHLRERKQSYLVGTPRSRLQEFEAELCTRDWSAVRTHVEIKLVQREGHTYVLARSKARRAKEHAMRKRQLIGLQRDLKNLARSVADGRCRDPDKVQQRIGRLRERWPRVGRFLIVEVGKDESGQATRVTWRYHTQKLRAALARDGAYLLLSEETTWTAERLWSTYMQLTRAEDAFRTLKSHQLLRPIWHRYDERIKAHIFVCVLAYVLWIALDHLLRRAGVMTIIRKPDLSRPDDSPKDRRMTSTVALRLVHDIMIGDILLETLDGRTLCLRRVARPNEEQAMVLSALGLTLPERLCADRQWPADRATPASQPHRGVGEM